jgi:hypothetical protein
MEAAHLRLFEITQSLQGDMVGNAMVDEVLTACFDHALGSKGALQRLVAALERLNSYLVRYPEPIAAGLFHGTPDEVSVWAEQLTTQILCNGER